MTTRYREFTCRDCAGSALVSPDYHQQQTHEALIKLALTDWDDGERARHEAFATIAFHAECLLAARVGLCRPCMGKRIKSEAGAAVSLLAGRRAA